MPFDDDEFWEVPYEKVPLIEDGRMNHELEPMAHKMVRGSLSSAFN